MDSSDTDSDSVQNDRIRSAVIDEADLYKLSGKCDSVETANDLSQPSTARTSPRETLQNEIKYCNTGLDVTPGFRKCLAQRLVDSLYSKIKFKKTKNLDEQHTEDMSATMGWGFRLFSSSDPSTTFYEQPNHQSAAQQRKRKHNAACRHSSSKEKEKEDERKFASAAVTADWILSTRDSELMSDRKNTPDADVTQVNGHTIKQDSVCDTDQLQTIANSGEVKEINRKKRKVSYNDS